MELDQIRDLITRCPDEPDGRQAILLVLRARDHARSHDWRRGSCRACAIAALELPEELRVSGVHSPPPHPRVKVQTVRRLVNGDARWKYADSPTMTTQPIPCEEAALG